MGFGSYSVSDRALRSASMGYATKSKAEIFKSRKLCESMIPTGVQLRESRDSEEHPNSVPIILGLDVTGSMLTVPHFLVKEGLPKIMEKIMEAGVPDPQILFLAIGDHFNDSAPLQIGQFESNDELLDKWLTDTYLEGRGGNNNGESYLLAWYFAANHTMHDALEKRGEKGLLITIGDEPTHQNISHESLVSIMGEAEGDCTADELLEKAKEKYNVYHLHMTCTRVGSFKETQDGWKAMLGDNVKFVANQEDVAMTIAELVIKHTDGVSKAPILTETKTNTPTEVIGL